MKKALIILNGYSISKNLLLYFWSKSDFRICADGSFHSVFENGLTPDLILGDLDSLKQETLTVDNKKKILYQSNQNTTDSQKALDYLKEKSFQEVNILGLIGSRADHLLFNLHLLKSYYTVFQKICLWTPSESIELATKEKIIEAAIGSRISLFPFFEDVLQISSEGLEYELKNQNLSFGGILSISNKVIKTPVRLYWEKGTLAVFLEHNLIDF